MARTVMTGTGGRRLAWGDDEATELVLRLLRDDLRAGKVLEEVDRILERVRREHGLADAGKVRSRS